MYLAGNKICLKYQSLRFSSPVIEDKDVSDCPCLAKVLVDLSVSLYGSTHTILLGIGHSVLTETAVVVMWLEVRKHTNYV